MGILIKKIVLSAFAVLIFGALCSWQVYRFYYKSNLSQSVVLTKITGKFVDDKTIYLYRLHENKTGYEIITPFLTDNHMILVSRGWSPSKNINKPVQAKTTISGYLVEIYKKPIFAPKNNFAKGEWYNLDMDDVAQYFGSNVDSKIFILENSTMQSIISSALKKHMTHIYYAITWAALGIISILYILKFQPKAGNQ